MWFLCESSTVIIHFLCGFFFKQKTAGTPQYFSNYVNKAKEEEYLQNMLADCIQPVAKG
jgi:hypothetical protein